MNPLRVLDACLSAHKSISFSRVDGEIRCTTSAGTHTAPDVETLFRDLGYRTADAQVYAGKKLYQDSFEASDVAREIYAALDFGEPNQREQPTIPAEP